MLWPHCAGNFKSSFVSDNGSSSSWKGVSIRPKLILHRSKAYSHPVRLTYPRFGRILLPWQRSSYIKGNRVCSGSAMNMNRGLRFWSIIHIQNNRFFSIVHLRRGYIAQVAKVVLLHYGKKDSQLGV